MDRTTRLQLVDLYEEGNRAITEAMTAVPAERLDIRPAPEEWSAREIVHHLADAEMTSADRLRRLLAEDRPLIHGYDEAERARRCHYDRPIGASLDAITAVRRTSLEILRRLGEDEWKREGIHPEHGPYSVELWLELYSRHAHDHARQITRLGEAAR